MTPVTPATLTRVTLKLVTLTLTTLCRRAGQIAAVALLVSLAAIPVVRPLGRIASAQAAPVPSYETFFTDAAMRVDYFHTGGLGSEIVAFDQVVADGAWPGSRTVSFDRSDLGHYRFEVVDPTSGQILYSRGFSSMYAAKSEYVPSRSGG